MSMKPFRALLAIAAVAGALAVHPAPAGAAGQTVSITWSSEDGAYKLAARPARALAPAAGAADVTVNVDPGARHQSIFGQGGVLESTSVWNIAHLSAAKRDQLMRQLFDRTTGNGYNVVRLAMGCSDMCSGAFYTYADAPDPTLAGFSIQQDADIVAVAKLARAINPETKFYLSMWSAPAWMKTNGSLINGGYVRPELYPVLARYQRLAIQAYQAQGIPITALTPQNEPQVVMPYPTGQWTGAQMRDYVKVLGAELRGNGLATQVWVGDENPPGLRDFVPAILDDPAARQYVGGVAVHDYTNDDPSVLADFRLRYPVVPLHLTERSYYGVNGEPHKVSGGWQAGVRRVMDFYRNGIASWTYWITFLDDRGGPSTGPLDASCCSVQFLAPRGNLDAYSTNRDYYLYGQFSRWVRPGAVRVGSDQTSTEVSNVAFRNPDGSVVVVVANGAQAARSVKIASPDGQLVDTLPALSVGTYRWANATAPADPRLGTVRLVNRQDPSLALQSTGDHYFGSPDSYEVVASPTAWNSLEQRWSVTSAGGGWYRLTSLARQSNVLHTTHETYGSWPDVYNTATTRSNLGWDEQLWQLVDTGDGFYRLVNKARGTVLQATGDAYGSFADVRRTVSSPAAWNLAAQQWRLVPG